LLDAKQSHKYLNKNSLLAIKITLGNRQLMNVLKKTQIHHLRNCMS